jgi:hypothetical protein
MVILTPTRIDSVWRQVLDYSLGPARPLSPAEAILEPAHG